MATSARGTIYYLCVTLHTRKMNLSPPRRDYDEHKNSSVYVPRHYTYNSSKYKYLLEAQPDTLPFSGSSYTCDFGGDYPKKRQLMFYLGFIIGFICNGFTIISSPFT